MSSKQPTPFRATLSVAVRQLRGAKGLSMRDLGERAGISHELVNQIERGLANPSIDIVTNLAKALGVEVATLAALPKADRNTVDGATVLYNETGRDLAGIIEWLKSSGLDTEIDILAVLANTPYALTYPWGVVCEAAKT